MISIDGAALIASLIPVALLIIALESKQAGSFVASKQWEKKLAVPGAIVLVGVMVAGFYGEIQAVQAVASGVDLKAGNALAAAAGMYATGILATVILILAILKATGLSSAFRRTR